MAVKYLASLDNEGWITDGQTILDTVMGWAYASDFSQSRFFAGDITSIAHIVQTNAGKLEKACAELQRILGNYLSKFFDAVEIECSVVEKEFPEFHLLGEVILRASMIDHSGKELQLHEVMTNKGSIARRVIDFQPY